MRRDASADDLRQAYRRKALDAHPDRGVDGAAADAMAAINEAWHVLGDPQRRAQYDQLLDDVPAAAPVAPPRPPPRHATTPPAPADDDEPRWVDHTRDVRTFRWMLTGALVIGGLVILLVFVFIAFPQSGH